MHRTLFPCFLLAALLCAPLGPAPTHAGQRVRAA